MATKPKRSKKATKSSKRTKVELKPVKETKVATKSAPAVIQSTTPATKPTTAPVTRSNSARAHISEGTRLYALSGLPTKGQFIEVYGPKGPKMTWTQPSRSWCGRKTLSGGAQGEVLK